MKSKKVIKERLDKLKKRTELGVMTYKTDPNDTGYFMEYSKDIQEIEVLEWVLGVKKNTD